MGFSAKNATVPARGARVAAWVQGELDRSGRTVGELAFAARVDKRDLRRLLSPPHSCGHRLEDDLAAYFGWDFTEAVMTPVHGADPTTARERELEQRLSQAAALHERVVRERALHAAVAPRLALVAGGPAVPGSQARGPGRSFDPPTPEGA
jgi:hypothetical protein